MKITSISADPQTGDDIDIVEVRVYVEVEATDVGEAAAAVLAKLLGSSNDDSAERLAVLRYLSANNYRSVDRIATEILNGKHLVTDADA
jgi:hypothetical protein